jgi:hypothetical protein
MSETYEVTARRTTAGTGEAYWFFDSLMVIRAAQPGEPVVIEATVAPGGGAPLQVHSDDSFLRFIRAVGQPAASRTLPPGLVPATDMDGALEVAARTGQPVIGPPMSEAEAAAVNAS